ncbi:MAG: hypothetical protein ABI469_02250 [Gemmatimonadales bacterium]
MADEKNREPLIPRSTDEENPPLDAASAESLRKQADKVEDPDDVNIVDPLHGGNPPHTTTGKFTAPKFGSAGSGGAEFEPGPERD